MAVSCFAGASAAIGAAATKTGAATCVCTWYFFHGTLSRHSSAPPRSRLVSSRLASSFINHSSELSSNHATTQPVRGRTQRSAPQLIGSFAVLGASSGVCLLADRQLCSRLGAPHSDTWQDIGHSGPASFSTPSIPFLCPSCTLLRPTIPTILLLLLLPSSPCNPPFAQPAPDLVCLQAA